MKAILLHPLGDRKALHAQRHRGSLGPVPQLFTYRHSDLVVASQLELPEWEQFSCAATAPDVRIILSDDPCPACPSDKTIFEEGTLRFAIDGIGGWQIEGGHTITLHPGLTTAPPELRLFTLGSAWGALGYQRGFAMWHGSAVERDGRAVVFCGDAGAGKSTMAAAMVADGASLVADDLSRIDPCEGGARIHPSSTRIKLWDKTIEHFGWQDRILQRDYFRDNKFHCSVPKHGAGEKPLMLSAIVILEEADEIALEEISGVEALGAVTRATLYRPEMLDAMGLWGLQGGLTAQILAKVPAYILRRPKSFDVLASDGGALHALSTCFSDT